MSDLKSLLSSKKEEFSAQLKNVNAEAEQLRNRLDFLAKQKEQLIGAIYALDSVSLKEEAPVELEKASNN